jgi:hypothetical protein
MQENTVFTLKCFAMDARRLCTISYEILDLFIRSKKKLSSSYMLSSLLRFCTVKFGFEIPINYNINLGPPYITCK